MVDKTEGAKMTCQNCNEDLVCHMSKYERDFENKLQWQNSDGSAHYKFAGKDEDGKTKFKCVMMDAEPKSMPKEIPTEKPNQAGPIDRVGTATQVAIQFDGNARKAVFGNMTTKEFRELPREEQKDLSVAKSVLFKGMVEIYKAV